MADTLETDDDDDRQNTFDFHAEAAEIQPDAVNLLQVEVVAPGKATITLVSLEDIFYELEWTV